ncbi:MAG: hypothetical protein EAX96_00060 [Candidatus Lokiarchaeota archaeon]|nr:hypothetical protein [Candidatus Lokiarchaeota archaeon]
MRNLKSLVIKGFKTVASTFSYELYLLPFPKEISEINGFLEITDNLHLHFKNINNQIIIKNRIMKQIAYCGDFDFKEITEENVKISVEEAKLQKRGIEDEQYQIFYSNGMYVINANSDKGIYYGANTFVQLIQRINDKIVLPIINIVDFPTYHIRTITDQPSRNQVPTVENIKKFITFISEYKLNYYFMYFEDAYNFEKYQDIGRRRGGYTKEEIREIQDHAKKYFVEIVPIFNSFGHVDNILMTNHPKYAEFGEFPGSSCYDIRNVEFRKFILELYDEICSTFESKWFHLGLDETFDFGRYKTEAIIKKESKGNLLLEYYNFLIEAAKERGKQNVIFYHDNLLHSKKLLKDLPKDVIVFYWDYWSEKFFGLRDKKQYKKAKKIQEHGFKIILSPTLYDWTRNYPDTRRTIKNIVSMAKYGIKINALGIATSIWGDFLNENLRENNYFGIMVTADAAWGPEEWDEKRFKRNFAFHFFGLENDWALFQAINDLNIYNDSHMLYPTKFTSHIWRHPFPSLKIIPKIKNLHEIKTKSQNALNIIKRLENEVKKNKDNLRYMKYSANLAIYLTIKYELSIKIQEELNKGKFELDSEEFISDITFLKNYINNLKIEYEYLWRKCAKPNGLVHILQRFNAQILFYQQKLEQIKNEIKWEDPYLDSEFITHPKKPKNGEPIYLRKKFTINKPIKACYIQGMSNMLMHLYINNEKLGEIISKMSLSVEPIVKRIQYFDITDSIKQEENVISAKCYNYFNEYPSGNIFLEITYKDGEKAIVKSDISWKSNNKEESDWKLVSFDDTSWSNAKSLGKPPVISGHVTKPYFDKDMKSQESYYYGMQTFMKEVLPRVPSFMIRTAIKLIGLDIF